MVCSSEIFVRASILSGFRDVVAARGLDAGGLLEKAGIAAAALDDPASELPLDFVALLMELAAERARDPGLGLALAEAYPAGGTGLLGYIFLHAPTLGEALQSFARYSGLLLDPNPVVFRQDADVARLSWCFPTGQGTRHVQFASFISALLVLRLRRMAGRDWYPLAVEVEYPELPCTAKLNRILGPQVVFNSRENSIAIDPSTLQRKIDGADPRLYRILQETGEAKLQELACRPDLVARTARAITETLSTDPPLLEHVAERMRMTPRTLQNRLARQRTSFERILSDTRRNLAERYLRDSNLSLTEIAFLLGFSEQSAFTRAARGWFGRPPRQLRKEGAWTDRSTEPQGA
ncbi:MAG: AraC family transcriptional regulator [Hyphomicrobiaceae bacterium]|nr:AraC family transcriptional regulator [Hyphomicrobiaceae bacterium]